MDITKINFDGLTADAFGYHEEYGVLVHKSKFMAWLGYDVTNNSRLADRQLQAKDQVKGVFSPIGTETKGGRKADALTARGVRRLLFRSDKPQARLYTDRVLDVLDEIASKGYHLSPSASADQLGAASREARSLSIAKRLEETDRLAIAVNISNSPNAPRLYSNISMLVNQCATGLSRREIKARLEEAGVKNFREAATPDELRRITALTQMYVASLELYVALDAEVKDIYAHAKRVCHGYAKSQGYEIAA